MEDTGTLLNAADDETDTDRRAEEDDEEDP